MSSASDPESSLENALSNTDYAVKRTGDGVFITYEGFEIKVLTQLGNPSAEISVIGETEYELESPHSIPTMIKAKKKLNQKGVLDEQDNLAFSELREPIQEFFSSYEVSDSSQKIHTGSGRFGKKTQEDVARLVKQEERGKAKARYIAEGTDYSPKIVGPVLGQWETDYDLDPDKYRAGKSNAVSWNLELLEEEEVIEDILEE